MPKKTKLYKHKIWVEIEAVFEEIAGFDWALEVDPDLNAALVQEDKEGKTFSSSEAIEALEALLNGEWDNKQLMKIGPLHTDLKYNLESILNATVPDC